MSFASEKLEVALPEEVKMGPATIVSTVDGISPKHYSIEILKTSYTTSAGDKCMVIRIVDENLLMATGGIVQGMSGSPIIQNGELVGVVSHVTLDNPMIGYAVYAKWMYEDLINY